MYIETDFILMSSSMLLYSFLLVILNLLITPWNPYCLHHSQVWRIWIMCKKIDYKLVPWVDHFWELWFLYFVLPVHFCIMVVWGKYSILLSLSCIVQYPSEYFLLCLQGCGLSGFHIGVHDLKACLKAWQAET